MTIVKRQWRCRLADDVERSARLFEASTAKQAVCLFAAWLDDDGWAVEAAPEIKQFVLVAVARRIVGQGREHLEETVVYRVERKLRFEYVATIAVEGTDGHKTVT